MKKFLFLLMIPLVVLTACSGGKKTRYGAKINEKGAIPASTLMAKMEGQDSIQVKVEGKVNTCCQKKGCWMTMSLNDDTEMRVRFKDYGFFVPKDAGGKIAVVDGWAHRKVIPVDMLRHYAEDEGKSADEIAKITEPQTQITFMADGVILKSE